ncbi:MAG: hypothetical protein IMW89_08185 [Ktedonobacteraceae bacterium]|nr:hypothetical protein [Ktedonobacteraceae bacterium]
MLNDPQGYDQPASASPQFQRPWQDARNVADEPGNVPVPAPGSLSGFYAPPSSQPLQQPQRQFPPWPVDGRQGWQAGYGNGNALWQNQQQGFSTPFAPQAPQTPSTPQPGQFVPPSGTFRPYPPRKRPGLTADRHGDSRHIMQLVMIVTSVVLVLILVIGGFLLFSTDKPTAKISQPSPQATATEDTATATPEITPSPTDVPTPNATATAAAAAPPAVIPTRPVYKPTPKPTIKPTPTATPKPTATATKTPIEWNYNFTKGTDGQLIHWSDPSNSSDFCTADVQKVGAIGCVPDAASEAGYAVVCTDGLVSFNGGTGFACSTHGGFKNGTEAASTIYAHPIYA